ncbi:MAG: peptidoglycan DD-metalloendopeptidase family protein [Anaerolineaceae bacterium]
MLNPPTSLDDAVQAVKSKTEFENETPEFRPQWQNIWEQLVRLGLGESTLRIGTVLVSFVFVALAVWVMGNFYLKGEVTPYFSQEMFESIPIVAPDEAISAAAAPVETGASSGIPRLALMHTTLPALPRFDVVQYTVVKGDTIFAIAKKFNLSPETILWGNYNILADNPHALSPDQVLNILPTNGVYYEWHAGDGLNGVADFYGVTPESIVSYPGNRLNAETIGDYAKPDIEVGSWLVIPEGKREFVTWSAPRITRKDPSVARIFGPGACGPISDGNIGGGTFVWPTTMRFISGFDYTPETNHYGIDIGGQEGNSIFATDSGVVVYAGWNDFGYGNVVVLDHGNGWQSLYAHLNSLTVSCGVSVFQGDVIGAMGSTGKSSGPHLHFEMTSDEYGRVNPKNFLQ